MLLISPELIFGLRRLGGGCCLTGFQLCQPTLHSLLLLSRSRIGALNQRMFSRHKGIPGTKHQPPMPAPPSSAKASAASTQGPLMTRLENSAAQASSWATPTCSESAVSTYPSQLAAGLSGVRLVVCMICNQHKTERERERESERAKQNNDKHKRENAHTHTQRFFCWHVRTCLYNASGPKACWQSDQRPAWVPLLLSLLSA